MKKFIHKTNKYLLENYPTLWNTKVVWILGITAIIHFIFFLFGLGCFTNPETLHERNAVAIFYRNGMVLFSVMISLVILVTWLFFMFKNNSFKSFYPTQKIDIFKQFLLYFIIIFSSTTFYYSYMTGVKTYITSTYEDTEMIKDVALANKTSPFFSHGIKNYTIDNVNFPTPLNEWYCENKKENIDYTKVYYQFLDDEYQFYDLKSETRKLDDPITNSDYYQYNVYTERNDSTATYYFKNEVQNITPYIKTIEPSYYNYSKQFYSSKTNTFDSNYYHNAYNLDYYENPIAYKKLEKQEELLNLNKAHYELLERNDQDEIKSILSNFLILSEKYKIRNNLNPEAWLFMVYQPENFKLKHIINDEKRFIEHDNLEYKDKLTPFEELYKDFKSEYYLESDSLGIVFENIDELKTKPIVSFEVHFYLWISFAIALLILVFRLTGLKPLLFSIIATVILIIFASLVVVLFDYTISISDDLEYIIAYFAFIMGTTILGVTLFISTKIKKQIAAIFINISFVGFVPYLILICAIITMHQKDNCRLIYEDYYNRKENCFQLLESLNPMLWSIIFLVIGFIFVYFFSKKILNWKAMPEG